ncbi:MAG: YkgJ family cysteine cluster protein [Deltaproteobacteria bacterium]|nr:YkgJ family cysteine cluster protein [Deltaproteobacteria bacterium]
MADTYLDCEEGRRLGCATFCCRLIVRLEEHERPLAAPGQPRKSCVDKDPVDGLCIHLDRTTHRCLIWEQRPAVCRTYECNTDPLLQVVLREGFSGLRALVTSRLRVPLADWRTIPRRPPPS